MKKLTVVNNWESYEWSIDGELILTPKDIKKVMINGKKYKVEWQLKTVYYSDMGHAYPATGWHGYVVTNDDLGFRASLYEIINTKKRKVFVE